MNPGRWDFCIIGAGPAGSALAAYLAEAGFKVLLLEKERFPRFQIGESLLPHLRGNDPLQLEAFHREIQWGYNVYERIVERFYRSGWVDHTFFLPNKSPQMVRQLNTILAGSVWRKDNSWQNALTDSRRRRIRYQPEKNPQVSP